MTNSNILEQELTTNHVAPTVPQAIVTSLSTKGDVEHSVERLAADIVSDAVLFPSLYLRRCVTGHDGE